MEYFICDTRPRPSETVIQFTHESSTKCRRVLSVRKMEKFKYQELNLNTENLDNSGYRMSCHRKFMLQQTVSKKL